MHSDQLIPNVIVRGPLLPEPVEVIAVVPMGDSVVKLIGRGVTSNQVYQPILNASQLAKLEATPEKQPFDGDPLRFRLGIEALRLGLAYEYDPYFSLSIARVDPLSAAHVSPLNRLANPVHLLIDERPLVPELPPAGVR